jgi:predicted  nucleic acid-binding Zn-ribbon protein
MTGSKTMGGHCPTCNLGWWLNPPVKIHGAEMHRCVECKAVYSTEMLTAKEMLSALKECAGRLRYDGDLCHDIGDMTRAKASWAAMDMALAAIAKAEGRNPPDSLRVDGSEK